MSAECIARRRIVLPHAHAYVVYFNDFSLIAARSVKARRRPRASIPALAVPDKLPVRTKVCRAGAAETMTETQRKERQQQEERCHLHQALGGLVEVEEAEGT